MPVIKKWADLDLDFSAHPNTGDLSLKTDEQSIIRSIRYTLLTNFYERAFHPEFGSNLVRQLFEQMTYASSLSVRDAILESINNFEPRVQITKVLVVPNYDKNAYEVTVRFFILNEEVERQTQFLLERNR